MSTRDEEFRREQALFEERAQFVRENYPGGSEKHQEIVYSCLDGFNVLEERDGSGNLDALLTYIYYVDTDSYKYCIVGLIVSGEDSRGEGKIVDLFNEVQRLAKDEKCEYLIGRADTDEGALFMETHGFYVEEVDGDEHYRFDLD